MQQGAMEINQCILILRVILLIYSHWSAFLSAFAGSHDHLRQPHDSDAPGGVSTDKSSVYLSTLPDDAGVDVHTVMNTGDSLAT